MRQELPLSFLVSLSVVFFLVLYVFLYLLWFPGTTLTYDFAVGFGFRFPTFFPLIYLIRPLRLDYIDRWFIIWSFALLAAFANSL